MREALVKAHPCSNMGILDRWEARQEDRNLDTILLTILGR
jgi:hypothetical protein